MNIFVLSPSYPNKNNSVANIFVKEQVKALLKLGHNIIVLTILKEPTKRIFNKIDKNINEINDGEIIIYKSQKTIYEARFHRLNQMFINNTFKDLYFYAINHYGKPDVIYAHFMSSSYAALSLNTGIPIITLEHSGNLMNNKISRFEKKCLNQVVSKSYGYIATSEKLKKSIVSLTNTIKNIHVIPNMVDEVFSYYPYRNEGDFCFFSLCRFDFDKRLDLLIDAFSKAFDENDAVILRIGGTGKEFHNISKQINDLNRNSQIKLLGRLNRKETLQQYKDCACFVLPSRHETFGMVWREALCVGRPVITTDHGGFSNDDFNDSFGIMIDVDNLDELIDALLYMKNNHDNYNLTEISSQNLKMYSSDVIAKKIERILLEAAKK